MSDQSKMMPKVLIVTEAKDIPTKPIDGKPTLVYWNILCLAQSIRLALVAAKVDFVDVRIEAGPPHGENYRQGWKQAKQSEALEQVLKFPNLPYLLDPDLVGDGYGLVQSDSILRHIGRKYGYLGRVPALTDMYVEQMYDFDMHFTNIAYEKGADATLKWFQTSLPFILKSFGRLFDNSIYLSETDEPSVADWKLYVILYKMTIIQDQLGNETTASILKADAEWVEPFMTRIESIPVVASYMASSSYQRHFLHSPHAKWRG